MRPIPLYGDHVMFRALPPCVGTARRFVRRALAGLGQAEVIDDAVLIADELVTNSVNATGDGISWVTLSVYANGSHVRLEVWDASPEGPLRREACADDIHGRGLAIVEQLATRWGCRWPAIGGKTVWAELHHGEAAEAVPAESDAAERPAERGEREPERTPSAEPPRLLG